MSSFNLLPKGWSLVEIANTNIQILDGDRGDNYPKKDEFSENGYCLFLSASNIKNDVFDLSSANFITEQKDALLRKGKLTRYDIVLTTRGTVGSVAYFHSQIPYVNLRINSGMVILRAGHGFNSAYLYQLFKSPVLKTQYNLYSSGSAQPQLPIKDLRRINLPIPKIEAQEKIAAILSAYDDHIDNNKHRIALLENMAEEIYREWFVRFRFPGYQTAEFEKGIPKGWEFKAISDICDEIRMGAKKKDISDDEKYLGLEHLSRKSISIKENDTAASINSNKLRFENRDILFGKIRPYLHKICLAHYSGTCSSDTIVIRPKDIKSQGFLLFTIFSETFIELATISSKGTKMPRADWDFLKALEIAIPTEQLLSMFQEKFSTIFQMVETLLASNENLQNTKAMLLPRLISGKLSVEDLDIQFPPSMQEDKVA